MKILKVVPIHKKVSKLTVSNCLPMSILLKLDKILEELMHIKFLDDEKTLYSKQFEFSKKFSTSHAIIHLTENIQKCVDDKQIACGVS